MAFKRAVKEDSKLRLAVSGPAGSGKTFTLLRIATELARGVGRIAVVDTEHGSASKYSHTAKCTDACTDPSHFDFDVIEPSKFDPRNLIDTITEALKGGYAVFVCDSLSHYWMGPDGELEMVDNAAKQSRSGNSFAAWKTVTPIHNQLVDTMLRAPIHILVSMRTKTEWVIEKDEKTGKNTPRKIGLQPVMRDGIEFEFDVCGEIDQDNTLTITKTRCSALTGKSINRPGPEMSNTLKEWLGSPAAQETRGDGEQQAAGQSPARTERPASPTQPAAAEEVPAALKALFEKLHQPGYVKQGFDLLKARMTALSPAGEAEFKAIQKRHQLTTSSTVQEYRAALLEMWNICEEWQRQTTPKVDDSDVTKASEPQQASLMEGVSQ